MMISYDDIKSGRAAVPAETPAFADEIGTLPAMVKAAAAKLASAATAAEVLDAKEAAALVYDASKRAGRIAKAKKAHDDVIAAAHRAQADALDIEAAAKRRLADEYDGGQERGEIATAEDTKRRGPGVPKRNAGKATAEDVGLTRKQVHDARRVRNAEKAKPGVVKEALDQAIAEGKEPTRAVVNAAVAEALGETHPVDDRTDAEREADAIQSPFDRVSDEGRALFMARNNLQFQAKASEDNGATGKATMRPADSMTGEVSRVDAGRTASATSERMDATAGETAQISRSAAISAVTAPDTQAPQSGAVPLSPDPLNPGVDDGQLHPSANVPPAQKDIGLPDVGQDGDEPCTSYGEFAQQPASAAQTRNEPGSASGASVTNSKPDCLKLKDGHCKLSFETLALCAECNAERMKRRAA